MKNKLLLLDGLFLLCLLAHAVYRDVQLEKQFPCDLRNRVVGARLEKDGILPYFYHWATDRLPAHQTDRYKDPAGFNQHAGLPSNITASPFFHQLLYPLCELSQRTISAIWTGMEYLLLAGMLWMACSLTADPSKKILLVNVAVLFTATEAWKSLIQTGQMYFITAFLMSCVIAGLLHRKTAGTWLAAVCAILFVLIRPVALVMFIPLVLQYKKNLLFLLIAGCELTIYGLFVLRTPFQNALWKEYAHAIKLHIRAHQGFYGGIPVVRSPEMKQLEGFDFAEVDRNTAEHPIRVYSENGNVFVLYTLVTGRKMPLDVLYALTLVAVLALTGVFYFFFLKHEPLLLQSLLLGFVLYLLVGVFSPVHRHQYYTVQWLPLLLSAFLLIRDWKNLAFLLLMLGLLLNIANISWIPMRHTLGEICWFAALLITAFMPINQTQWKQPS